MLRRDDSGTSRSPQTLLWISIGLLIVGAAIGSPVGAAAVTIVAGLCALAPIALGSRRIRILGLIALVATVVLAVMIFPAARQDMQKYREHAVKSRPAGQDIPGRNP